MIGSSTGGEVGAEIRRCSADEECALSRRELEDLFSPGHFIEN
jgi:hypothetical protein